MSHPQKTSIPEKMLQFFKHVKQFEAFFLQDVWNAIQEIKASTNIKELYAQQTIVPGHEQYRSSAADVQNARTKPLANPFPLDLTKQSLNFSGHFEGLSIMALQRHNDKPSAEEIDFYYFLIVPIRLSETSKCSLQMAVPIEFVQRGGDTRICLSTTQLFKLKSMVYTPAARSTHSTELRPNLALMEKLYPNDTLYTYDRPLGRAELEADPQPGASLENAGDNIFYLISPFISGEPLSSPALNLTQWSLEKKILFIRKILALATQVHQLGYMIKDVKPDNFIVSGDNVYLIDVEQAESFAQHPLQRSTSTTTGFCHPIVGTEHAKFLQEPKSHQTQSEQFDAMMKGQRKHILSALMQEPTVAELRQYFTSGIDQQAYQTLLSPECAADIYGLGHVFLRFFMTDEELNDTMLSVDPQHLYYNPSCLPIQRTAIIGRYINALHAKCLVDGNTTDNNATNRNALSTVIKMLETNLANNTVTTLDLFHHFSTIQLSCHRCLNSTSKVSSKIFTNPLIIYTVGRDNTRANGSKKLSSHKSNFLVQTRSWVNRLPRFKRCNSAPI
jgi:serine/threonine protein kinase